MPVISLEDVPLEQFHDGATYQTIVGDDEGSTPVRLGLQVSPPGFSTGDHYHPYMEIVTVIDGEGEARIDGTGVRFNLLDVVHGIDSTCVQTFPDDLDIK